MKDKIIKIILIVLGIVCIIYCALVVLIIGTGHWFNFAFGIVGFVLMLDGILFDELKKLNKKCPKVISILIVAVILLCFINFSIFEAKAIAIGRLEAIANAKYMIVLGAKVNGTTPSLEFNARIEKAIEYAKENPNTIIILTGGKGSDEGIAESEAAKRKFLSAGINEDRIYIETKSTTTNENFIYAKEIVEKQGSIDDCVLIVSSQFHLYRASNLAQNNGFLNISTLGSVGLKILLPQYYVREYAATIAGRSW